MSSDYKQRDDRSNDDEVLLEKITIHPSKAIEAALLEIGEILADTFLETNRYDEAMVLYQLSSGFCYAAEQYGIQTERLRSDLGVSLSESMLLKIEAFRKNDLQSPADNEWWYFAKDAQDTVRQERQERYTLPLK